MEVEIKAIIATAQEIAASEKRRLHKVAMRGETIARLEREGRMIVKGRMAVAPVTGLRVVADPSLDFGVLEFRSRRGPALRRITIVR